MKSKKMIVIRVISIIMVAGMLLSAFAARSAENLKNSLKESALTEAEICTVEKSASKSSQKLSLICDGENFGDVTTTDNKKESLTAAESMIQSTLQKHDFVSTTASETTESVFIKK